MSTQLATIDAFVEEARRPFESALVDRSLKFESESRFAVQALSANDFTLSVARSNPQSVINAVANLAAIGLSLNPAKRQAYLVPRKGKICLDVGYIGLLDLAIESGSIRWGQSELVHAADTFHLDGVDKPPVHLRDPFATDRGLVVGAYVVVKTRDGDYLTTSMPVAELLNIRDRSEAYAKSKSGPWVTDPGEMMKKTVIKRAYKLWPKTDRLTNAIQHLNTEGEEGLPAIENADPLDGPRYLGVTVQRAKLIRKSCGEALDRFNVNDELGAYEILEPFSHDNDDLLAVTTALHAHSDLRAALKRIAIEIRERDAQLAEMKPPVTTGEAA